MIEYILLIIIPWVIYIIARRSMKFTTQELGTIDAKGYWKTGNHVTILTFFGIYFLLLALRADTVGVDLKQYVPRFQSIALTPWDIVFRNFASVEPGYIILNKLISLISTDPQFFLASVALITIVPIAILYKNEAEQAMLTISIFLILPLFSMFFSGLRQSIAIAMAAPAFYFVKNKKKIPFLLIVLLAYSFHASGIVLILLYPLYHIRITKKWLYGIVPFIGGIYAFNGPVFNFLLLFMGDKYQDRYSQLTDTGAYSMLVLLILLACYSFIFINDKQIDDVTRGLRNILLFSVILQLFTPISPIAMRMNYYYLLFIPLVISRVSVRYKTGVGNIVWVSRIIMCIVFISYFIYKGIWGTDILEVFPYTPFWL